MTSKAKKQKELEEYELERQRHKEPIDITISTKVPSKWLFVDRETGNIWKWDETKKGFVDSNLKGEKKWSIILNHIG